MRIGVECGGTFTDLVVLDDDGALRATDKVFSTPSRPADAVKEALSHLNPVMLNGSELLHGSTVATNALIERVGARVGLLITQGFRDVVFLQRQDRSRMYDLTLVKPNPLVARDDIAEVDERLDERGSALRPLDHEQAGVAIQRLLDQGVEAFAVSLLHSYANPEHELALESLIHEYAPEMTVSLSSRSAREFREYERTTTTIIDAFLRPHVQGYLAQLDSEAATLGLRVIHVMQSNGGTVPARTAATNPLTMLRSGPAAGVAGAIAVARAAGEENVVTMDMGGTSTDVAVIRQGETDLTTEIVADGLPVRVPMVDIAAVGAGGGSLVDVDSGGMLTVGPRSAGADPGPVAYQRGGNRPTVTDANLVRGLLRPQTFLGGSVALDVAAARSALTTIGQRLGRSAEQLAEDIFRLASVHMASAIRMTTTERGHEVSEYTLCAYGGAGAMHAAAVAQELNITKVIVPPYNGLASAYGLLTAGFRREFSMTQLINLNRACDGDLRSLMKELLADAEGRLGSEGIDVGAADYAWAADMRYLGQGFEVLVPLPFGTSQSLGDLAETFTAVQGRRFGFVDADKDIQLVTLRLTVSIPAQSTTLPRVRVREPQPPQVHPIVEDGVQVQAVFHSRAALPVGARIDGPAVIEDDTSTTFVPSQWTGRVDANTNLILEHTRA